MQTQTSNTLHNAIMKAGGKDRPPMLASGNYVQWKSRIKRYIDTKPNHEHIHYCLKNPPYKFTWTDKEVPIFKGSSVTTTETYMETYKNVSQDIHDQLNAEAEVVQIILTGIDNDIYSTVDAYPNACEMWKAIERFYKMMNELIRNQCDVTNHQVNVQFLLQLQPEWQRVEKIVRTANPLALVAQQQPVYHPQNHPTHYTQNSSSRSQQAATRNKGKAIVNSRQPIYDQEPSMVAEDDETEQIDQNDDDDDLANEREIEDFKNKNKSLESSNNRFKEENNKLSETNKLLYNDFKKSQAELERRNDVEYASKKKAQIKLYKTREDKELDNVIALENKVKVLDNIVYKTGQSVQTMNMLNNKCRTSFAKTEFLKKAQRVNPRLYDIGCYNDNIALMLAPESDEVICLEEESQSKLRDLIRPFDYNKLNNLYDLFVPQREKSSEQRYFSERSRLSHTLVNNGNSKESFNKQSTLLEKRMDESISTKMPVVVPVSTREPKRTVTQSVAKPLRKTVASESNQYPRNITRKLYERVSKLIEIVLFIVDSGCSKHMIGNLKLLINFVEKFLGSRGTDLYSITLQDTNSPNLICLMAKTTSAQAWLWYRRLSHLNFDTINLISKNDIVTTPSSKRRLQLLHMDLCGPMRVASINGKRYVLVIVDDYSRYTWTHFLRSKDKTPEVLIDFLMLVQRGLHAQVRIFRTDKGMEFLNKTLHAYFASEGILHQTIVEAARTMLSAAKVPLFFWAEAIATVCFTQNRSLVIPRHEKTPYHIINERKLSVKFFYIFGSICYIVRDGENHDKMKEKGDACIFVGYSTQSRAYRVFKKRTRVIVETIHVNFDELPQMALDHVSSDPEPQCQKTTLKHDSLSPGLQCQENVTQADRTVTTSNELDLLFSLMFAELINGSSQVVSKSFAVTTADASNQRQQQNKTPLNNQTTPEPTCQVPPQASTVASIENINQAEIIAENAQVENDEFINIFCTPLESDAEICMFTLIVSRTEPKNIKEAMADSAWIKSMQEELYQFDQLDVWELVDRPLYGFIDPYHPEKVYRLKKALYGLKQAPRAWYDELLNFLVSKGFSKGSIDPTLFITKHRGDILLVQIYVDDIIFGSTNLKLLKQFEKLMHNKFEMSMMGELKFFLGIQIHQSPHGIFINQAKYGQEILIKHDMTSCDSVGTPMATKHLDADLSGTPIDQTKFRSMVGALMYLTASRPDIMHATCYCARYQAKPTEKHLTAVKRIFRYLKDTIHMGLWYPKDAGFELTTFSDSDHAGCLDSCKSTSGGIQFLGGDKLVSWSSKKQDCTLMSSRLADLFTKALPEERFKYLVRRLGMRCLTPEELEVLANESA
nr:retrovirus-related Pol polyprotein from transposon TNT 1-94 [Tanacetum cinerariifolium]